MNVLSQMHHSMPCNCLKLSPVKFDLVVTDQMMGTEMAAKM